MTGNIQTEKAPEPVGNYPHARKVGNLLFLSGVGPRKPGTNVIPGVMMEDRAMLWAMILKLSAILFLKMFELY